MIVTTRDEARLAPPPTATACRCARLGVVGGDVLTLRPGAGCWPTSRVAQLHQAFMSLERLLG